MNNLEEKLENIKKISETPKEQLNKYIKDGKKVIGIFPVYTPEEIVYASGMIPMGLWGAKVEPYLAKTYVPAFCCPIMQECLELGLNGSYDGLKAVLIPTLCDTFRCITQNWKVGVESIPMIAVTYPQNRTDAATKFLSGEYNIIKTELEKISGNSITEDSIQNAIEIYNEHNKTMRAFSKTANDHLDIITAQVRHAVMKSAWFMDKKEHTEAVKEIINELEKIPKTNWSGKRVILTGIIAEPAELLKVFEENNIAVVGDDLGQEMRQYRTDIPKGENGIRCLALQWRNRICSLAHDVTNARTGLLLELARDNKADGVIACMMKFCDPEEYDFPIYSKALEEIKVPTLYLEIDHQSGSIEQMRTRVQTFTEMI